jgi:hypothetical protein
LTRYLAHAFGLEHPKEAGVVSLGFLPENIRLDLLKRCLNETIPAIQNGRTIGSTGLSVDLNYHPDLTEKCDMDAYWTQGSDLDGPDIQSLHDAWSDSLKVEKGIFEFLTCSYMSAHTDESRHEHAQIGSIAIILDAPLGCNLLVDWNKIYPAALGEILLINDEALHAAYPVKTGSSLNGAHDAQIIEDRCMSFLLINSYDVD